ncbi:Hypothetical_protein [Hexamita inflata]|uniref:Hypothetical_protein n=1 Tax=Hexamita inflata TaxID=28002 RepID=A0ABP1GXM4_9EUKA
MRQIQENRRQRLKQVYNADLISKYQEESYVDQNPQKILVPEMEIQSFEDLEVKEVAPLRQSDLKMEIAQKFRFVNQHITKIEINQSIIPSNPQPQFRSSFQHEEEPDVITQDEIFQQEPIQNQTIDVVMYPEHASDPVVELPSPKFITVQPIENTQPVKQQHIKPHHKQQINNDLLLNTKEPEIIETPQKTKLNLKQIFDAKIPKVPKNTFGFNQLLNNNQNQFKDKTERKTNPKTKQETEQNQIKEVVELSNSISEEQSFTFKNILMRKKQLPKIPFKPTTEINAIKTDLSSETTVVYSTIDLNKFKQNFNTNTRNYLQQQLNQKVNVNQIQNEEQIYDTPKTAVFNQNEQQKEFGNVFNHKRNLLSVQNEEKSDRPLLIGFKQNQLDDYVNNILTQIK